MNRTLLLGAGLALAALLAGQETIANEVPALQGVYYRAAEEWIAMPFTILSPYPRSTWKWWLGVGRREMGAEVPGAHAPIATGTQPVFIVKGMGSRITPIVVRLDQNADFRSIRMPMPRLHEPRTPFHDESRVSIETHRVSNNVLALRPTQPLEPGEYAVLASPNPSATMQFLSYDFRVAP